MTLAELLELAKAKGTDKQFRQWVQRQVSCISGRYSEWVNGEGRCIAAHVRRAGRSGTAFKEAYACVPLTREEHDLQHLKGETHFASKEWWDGQRVKYLKMWVES